MKLPAYLFLFGIAWHPIAQPAEPVRESPMPKSLAIRLADSDQPAQRGVIKLTEPALMSQSGAQTGPLDLEARRRKIENGLARYDRVLSPLFADAEMIEHLAKRAPGFGSIVDLNLYFQFDTNNLPARHWLALIRELNASPLVEVAYLESPDLSDRQPSSPPQWKAPPGITPLFTALQGYLKPAPTGIDAFSAWSKVGGNGAGVKMMVYDNSFISTHEDVPPTFYNQGQNVVDGAHGTAVLGILGGRNNGLGIKGIAYGAKFGFQGAASTIQSHAERLAAAAMQLDAGDVLLIEVGKKVNALGFECECNPTQANVVPLEFYPAEHDVIRMLSMAGITVVETAGNGCVDFDSPVFENMFDNAATDSEAIWVAAGKSTERTPMCYTNHGIRVDVHAWGESVVTLSYLRDGEIPVFDKGLDRLYVPNFGGTSSAGAIVAGAVASVQGQAKAAFGQPLAPTLVRLLLVGTGTPQTGGFDRQIGPMPDLGSIDF